MLGGCASWTATTTSALTHEISDRHDGTGLKRYSARPPMSSSMHTLACAKLRFKQLEGKWVIMKAQRLRRRRDGHRLQGLERSSSAVQDVTIMTDACVRKERIYSLQLDTWTLFSWRARLPGFFTEARPDPIMARPRTLTHGKRELESISMLPVVALAGTSSASLP